MVRALALDVRTCEDPGERLLTHLTALDARQEVATQAALFEAVVPYVDVGQFWNLYRMSRVYAHLGRRDLAFLLAARGACVADDRSLAGPLMREVFVYHRDRGEARQAVEAFLAQATEFPEQVIADRWEVEPLVTGLGLSLDPPKLPAREGARRDHPLHPESERTGVAPPFYGRHMPVEVGRLAGPLWRSAVGVAELPDAEVFIRHNSLAVVDRDGNMHLDLSLGAYPHFLRDRVARDPDAHTLDLAEAVVVSDRFPPPNLCHFLLDQVSRLGLYEQAGATLPGATVIGPRLHPGFQQEIASRARVAQWLFTDIVARVRVRRLWVSTDCRDLHHPAQRGAPWTIAWVRQLLGPATRPGTRRLFISRGNSPNRRLLNEDVVLGLAQARGFDVVVPGELPYEEQLAAFRDASHIVACHGAGLAHLVVCAPGTQVLEMFHPLYSLFDYALVAESCGLDYAAMTGRDGVADDPLFNDPAVAGGYVAAFGDRHIRIDPADFAAWLDAHA